MTEIEAIKRINECRNTPNFQPYHYVNEALDMGIKALEEIQEYRAIGTAEELKFIKQWKVDVVEGFCKYDASSIEELVRNVRNKAIDEFAEKITLGISESFIWDMLATANENSSLSDTSDKIVDYVIDEVKKIAEQMIGGAE